MNREVLRQALAGGRVRWLRHVLERMMERDLSRQDVLETLAGLDIVEDYPLDQPFPSALFLAIIAGRPIHVVASLDEAGQECYIITVYRPDRGHFESDWRTRR